MPDFKDTASSTRETIIKELQEKFPEHAQEVPEIVASVEETIFTATYSGYVNGFEHGWGQARKANKVLLAVRAWMVIMLCPVFVTVGSKLAGQSMVGLFVGGIVAAFTLFLVDEATESLFSLFKKGDKDGKSRSNDSGDGTRD
jgi:hypothetical protein